MVSRRYTVMLAACLATGWSYPAFSAEPAAEPAAVPAELSAEPAAVPAEPSAEPAAEATTTPVEEQIPAMQLAPISVSLDGLVGYDMRRQTINTSKYVTQSMTANVGVNAQSFIWQPWFARVNGGLGLGTYRASGNIAESKSGDTYVTGRAALALVPRSPFPFDAHFERGSSQQSSGLGDASTDYQSTTYGMTQRYEPPGGNGNFMLNYEHSRWDSLLNSLSQTAIQNRDEQAAWRLETRHRFVNQKLDISGASTRNERPANSESSLLNSLSANHNYRADDYFSVDSLASLTNANSRLALVESSNKNAQLSSNAYWRSTKNDVTANGGMRLYENDSGGAASVMRSINMYMGASYLLSARTQLSASAGVSQTDIGGIKTVNSNESVGAGYTPDMIDLGSFKYARTIGGAISNQNGGPAGSTQHFSLTPSHGVSRIAALGGGTLAMDLSQMLGWEKDSRDPTISRLMHQGSLGWSLNGGQNTTSLRLSASDSHNLSGVQEYFQLINLQGVLSGTMSRRASWNGGLTLQKSRQGGKDAMPTTDTGVGVNLGYRHSQVFGVPRLQFASDLNLNNSEYTSATSASGLVVRETRVWENRLEYAIGKLQSVLSLRMAEADSSRDYMLWFSLKRHF